jgi:hypothetical protein
MTQIVIRTVAGVVSAITGALWLLFVYMVVSSRFSTDPFRDPHGYGLIFGTMLATVTGIVFAVALPFAFGREHRARVGRIVMPAYLIATALLFAAWLTA